MALLLFVSICSGSMSKPLSWRPNPSRLRVRALSSSRSRRRLAPVLSSHENVLRLLSNHASSCSPPARLLVLYNRNSPSPVNTEAGVMAAFQLVDYLVGFDLLVPNSGSEARRVDSGSSKRESKRSGRFYKTGLRSSITTRNHFRVSTGLSVPSLSPKTLSALFTLVKEFGRRG